METHGGRPRPRRAGARGVRRGARGPAPRASAGWSCWTATGAAPAARSTWCCATGDDARGVRGEDPQRRRPSARPTRRSPPVKLARLRRLAARWLAAHGLRRARGAHRPGRASLRPRARRLRGRARRGDRLMPFATAHTVSLHGALGHLIDVQADVSPGHGRHHPGRPARRLAQRGARPLPDGGRSTAGSTGRRPGGSRSCCRRPTCSSAAPTSTWRSRSSVLAAAGDVPRRELVAHRVHRRADPGRRSCGRCRACCRWCWRRPSAGSAGSSCPEPQAREAAMVPGHGRARHALAGPGGRRAARRGGARRAAGRADVRRRLLSWRGSERMEEVDLADLVGMADARYAVEVAAAGGHHLLLSGPKGAGKTSIAERIPGHPARPHARGVARADRGALAGRRPRARRRACSPGRRSPRPHHDASKASLLGGGSGPGAARRDQPGPLRGALPRRVPAVPRRRDRGAAPAAGERRDHRRPRATSR